MIIPASLKLPKPTQNVLQGLSQSCLAFSPSAFIPYLIQSHVKTTYLNKTKFYAFYKLLLLEAQCEGVGPFTTAITDGDTTSWYYFMLQDGASAFELMTIRFTFNESNITLDLLPF